MAFNVKAAFRALFGGDAPKSAGGLLSGVMMGGARAPRRGTRELLLAYRQQPWLRAVVQRIAQDVAGVPFRLLAPTRGKTKAFHVGALPQLRRKMLDDGLRSGSLVELQSHPMMDLLSLPNPALRGIGSLIVTQAWLDLKGEAFWVLERNGMSQPVEAWPIPPHWVAEIPTPGRPFFRASAYGWHKEIPESDVLWFRSPDMEHPYARGSGIGESLSDELDVDEFAAKHIRDWFLNGGRPSGFVSLEGAGEEEVERFREKWRSQYQGMGRAHQVHFTNAKLGYEDLSHTFKDQELLALRKYQADLVRETFGVPPEVLGIIENSNRATIDSSYYLYARGVLMPRLVGLCDTLQALASEWDERLIVDFHSPVPEDMEFRKSVMLGLPGNFTINEHRALAGAGPADDGDEMYSPPAPASPFGSVGLRADPPWTKAVLPVSKQEGIFRVLAALRPDVLTDETGPIWERQVAKWGARVLEELGADGAASFSTRNPLVKFMLEESGERIANTNETTREALRDVLKEGVLAGEGVDKLKERVRSVFDACSAHRAETIARTETVGSSNKANLVAYQVSGVVEGKEWLAVRDGNARPEHAELDGQQVALTSHFKSPDGMEAMHPGGFGRPEADINCRCTLLPVVTDLKGLKSQRSEEQKAAEWKAFNARALSWEKEAASALRRAYEKQEAEVMAELERVFGKAQSPRKKYSAPKVKSRPQLSLGLE